MSGAAATEMPPSAEVQAEHEPLPMNLNEEQLVEGLSKLEERMSEVLSDDSEANDNIRWRGNATRYTLFHGPVNTRLEMPWTGFEAVVVPASERARANKSTCGRE